MRSRWSHVRTLAAIAALTFTQGVAAQEKGFTLRTVDVREKPFLDAKAVGQIPDRTAVTVLGRQGGWMQVQTAERKGWVRLLSVRLGNPEPARNETTAATFFGSLRGRNTASATVTTGVRGFSEEDLKAAQPNPEEVKKMDAYAQSPDPYRFAESGKLTGQNVPYVDANGRPEGDGK